MKCLFGVRSSDKSRRGCEMNRMGRSGLVIQKEWEGTEYWREIGEGEGRRGDGRTK